MKIAITRDEVMTFYEGYQQYLKEHLERDDSPVIFERQFDLDAA
jgi:hypothetical protein